MLFEKIQTFVDNAKRARALTDVSDLMHEITGELGFDYYALLYALRQNAAPSETINLTSYPASWTDSVLERAYWVDDPVFAACELADAGFNWKDIPAIITLNERQRNVLKFAATHGLRSGFTVPIPKCGAIVALCSFATRREDCVDAPSTAAAQAVGWFAFEAVRRIVVTTVPEARNPAHTLTPRQLDCIVLYARGKSDAVAGRLLGISRKTANEHIENAKSRYGVATRQQLLARALWHGQLSFADILQ